MNKVVLLCRPGFEKECAAEITDKAGKRFLVGWALLLIGAIRMKRKGASHE
ncbi:hypothetical protein NCM69_002519 [Salmonella enterica]|nr:hypothetical protein [Salmonella enterica]